MGPFKSISERRRDEAARRSSGAMQAAADLLTFARAKGGRYLLFGSAARGEMRHDSDIDLLLDFPEPLQSEAWRHAEETCAMHGLEADVKPLRWCTPDFVARVSEDAVVLD